MKSFAIPPNVQLTNPTTGAPMGFVTFKRWFIETVLNDKRMGFSPAKLARVMTMMGKVAAAEVGGSVSFEDADYDACAAVVKEPELALGGPALCVQLLPFPTAFLAAEEKG